MTYLYSLTLFVSAFLLFWIQPLIAKAMLPFLGGTPAVWNTCMLFFQVLLLLAYLYAHYSTSKLKKLHQVSLHLCLLFLGALAAWQAPDIQETWGSWPVLQVIQLLGKSIGIPFFVLAASAPLLQYWFSKCNHGRSKDPYFLYVFSNFGSFLALILFPVWIESTFTLSQQRSLWAAVLVLLGLLFLGCAWFFLSQKTAIKSEKKSSTKFEVAPSASNKFLWVMLSFLPCSLSLSLTSFLSTEIITMPLLWIFPLSLYLASFLVAFSDAFKHLVKIMQSLLPYLVVLILFISVKGFAEPLILSVCIHLLSFFIAATAFHGELAFRRPQAQFLSSFYLYMAIGGALGGVFNALVAPVILNSVLEYPLMWVGAAILLLSFSQFKSGYVEFKKFFQRKSIFITLIMITGIYFFTHILLTHDLFREMSYIEIFSGQSQSQENGFMLFLSSALRGLLCVLPLLLRRYGLYALVITTYTLSYFASTSYRPSILYQERNFYGVHRIEVDTTNKLHLLFHGKTVHGVQSIEPSRAGEALGYYHATGPAGEIFNEHRSSSENGNPVAIIGLGTGALATYARNKEKWIFYELDSSVLKIAQKYFTYTKNSDASIETKIGDARLQLVTATDNSLGLLVVDAFSSDAIPAHLLTREAFDLYFDKLRANGILALHISNRYVSLEPVIGRLAKELNLDARVRRDHETVPVGKFASTWVILRKQSEPPMKILKDPTWRHLPVGELWTDDYSNIMRLLKLKPDTELSI